MPKYYTFDQGDTEWEKARLGKVTASEIGNLITPEWKIRTGETPHTYLCKKVAEAYRNAPLPGFNSWQTDQGIEREQKARAWACMHFRGERIHNCGFVEHDDGTCGCSPDALSGDDGGLEIKSPECPNHVKYLLAGELPKDYAPQVHMSLYVTGRAWWRFISYRHGFPPFVLRVDRDEAICAKIAEAVSAFTEKLNTALARLRAG